MAGLQRKSDSRGAPKRVIMLQHSPMHAPHSTPPTVHPARAAGSAAYERDASSRAPETPFCFPGFPLLFQWAILKPSTVFLWLHTVPIFSSSFFMPSAPLVSESSIYLPIFSLLLYVEIPLSLFLNTSLRFPLLFPLPFSLICPVPNTSNQVPPNETSEA